MRLYSRLFCSVAVAVSFLAGCVSVPEITARRDTAAMIATRAGMTGTIIPAEHAGGYDLAIYTRAGDVDQPLRIYLEGDGLAWISRTRPSGDPTPVDPVALRLAAVDAQAHPALTVVWIARPCQYIKAASCTVDSWTAARFSDDMIDVIDRAVSQLKERYPQRPLELVGYSGGAAAALLVAARQPDVASVRTVAGTLDTAAFADSLGVSRLQKSLNPADVALDLSRLPQVHFTGGRDTIILPTVYAAYAAKAGAEGCRQHHIVETATHDSGWEEKWPALLEIQPRCK